MSEVKKIILFDIDHTLFDTDSFFESQLTKFTLYEEVYASLEKLSKIASFGVFSQGEIAFQRRKLQETNIKKYFQEEYIHIGEDKIEMIKSILRRYRDKGKIFLVEDRLPFLPLVKQYEPSIFTVWMKRGFFALSQEPIANFTPDATIDNLRDLVPLISNV